MLEFPPTRSGLEKGSDYGLSKKYLTEQVQFFIAKTLDVLRPRHSSIWGVGGPQPNFGKHETK